MRISDWSSDVCSSDLHVDRLDALLDLRRRRLGVGRLGRISRLVAGLLLGGRGAIREGGFGRTADAGGQHIGLAVRLELAGNRFRIGIALDVGDIHQRSEEHTSELQSLMRISYAVFCLKKKKHESD